MSNVHGSKWIRPSKRLAIYDRDGAACVYCHATVFTARLTLDHLQPRELGGTNEETNLVTACVSCNSARQSLSLRAWFRRLRSRGVNTDNIAARIRRQTSKPLDTRRARAA